MGRFVMGCAYQSFLRFEYVTLWRSNLANLTSVALPGVSTGKRIRGLVPPLAQSLLKQ
jgi:hypothetical protein